MLREATVDLFGDMDDDLFKEIESQFTWHKFRRGEILFRQGDEGSTIYLIISGRLQVVVKKENAREEILTNLGRGEWVGEMALLLNEPRSTTVTATRDTEIVALEKDGFDTVIEHHPRALMPMVQTLARRLRATTSNQRYELKEQQAITIAVVPLSRNIPPVPEPIIQELEAVGAVLHLDADGFDRIHGENASFASVETPSNNYLDEWQWQQEEKYRFIVYRADYRPTPWTIHCLRHADKVLLVGYFNASPKITEVERIVEKHAINAPRELVLLHRPETLKPKDTDRWLAGRNIIRHHHLRIGSIQDSQRIGRLLTRRATGLVLSGGGARAFAHIGVIKALREHGVAIDAVGGTSMGAYIAALYANDLDHDQITKYVHRVFLERPKGIHYTLPYTSLMSISRSENRIKQLLEGIKIEDLWTNFFCISTSLTHSEMVVHKHGELWRALRASTALPGIFPPVLEGDDVLVDGGAINVLPIDVMDKQEMKHVIASDVSRPGALRGENFDHEYANFAEVLWSRINPFCDKIHAPRASEIMLVSMDLTSVMRKRKNMRCADLYLAPPIEKYSLLEMEQMDKLIIEGYAYTREKLEHGNLF